MFEMTAHLENFFRSYCGNKRNKRYDSTSLLIDSRVRSRRQNWDPLARSLLHNEQLLPPRNRQAAHMPFTQRGGLDKLLSLERHWREKLSYWSVQNCATMRHLFRSLLLYFHITPSPANTVTQSSWLSLEFSETLQ